MAKDALDAAKFDAVKTWPIRVEVKWQPEFSGGLLQLKAE
jgi:hypothetical protein